MDSKMLLKGLLDCVDDKKLSVFVVEQVALAALKKVVDDSTNKFDDAAYAMLVPLLVPQLEAALGKVIADLKA